MQEQILCSSALMLRLKSVLHDRLVSAQLSAVSQHLGQARTCTMSLPYLKAYASDMRHQLCLEYDSFSLLQLARSRNSDPPLD